MATSRSMDELGRRIEILSGSLSRNLGKLIGSVITEVGKDIVPATPVDTGYARGNWRPSIAAPAESPISFLDATGAATISRIALVGLRYKVGDVFYLVNRAPYIGSLIAGSSPQAPVDFHIAAVRTGTKRAFATFQGKLITETPGA